MPFQNYFTKGMLTTTIINFDTIKVLSHEQRGSKKITMSYKAVFRENLRRHSAILPLFVPS